MNNQSQHQRRAPSDLHVNRTQEEMVKLYADRVGEKIGKLVSEIIVDSLTLLWMEKSANLSPPGVREKNVTQEQTIPDRLMNAPEIAKRLGISKAKAYQLMQTGEIPTVRIGSTVRVRPQGFEEYFKRSVTD